MTVTPMRLTLSIATLSLLLVSCSQVRAGSCESLGSAALPNTTVTTAESVPAGSFMPPYGSPLQNLPAFCRITGIIKPSTDSYIRFEVWLPASGWNEKFLGVGNGGFAGSISYTSLADDLRRGYATAATDTGHEGEASDASWAYKHPEKVIDFGYRALHVTIVNAKTLTEAFYDRRPVHSYFDACSNGGREALIEAQRFPEDFDGILAGAPANNWTHMLAGSVDISQAMFTNPAAYISSVKLPAITAAVRAACDAQDGVKDGVINDPPKCNFDPNVLLCKGPESRACLTAPQIASLKKLYAGSRNAKGEVIFPGYTPGGEEGPGAWSVWITGSGPGGGALYPDNFLRYMVFEDPSWSYFHAKVDDVVRAADRKTASILNATDPDLHRFQARGGKLILYHGWNDPAIAPLNAIDYYKSVQSKMNPQVTSQFVRLYMAPGLQHCIGGPGASAFGQLGVATAKGPKYGIYDALEAWVEKGTAPRDVTATKYAGDGTQKVLMTRPLCPYPEVAKYKGSGDTNDSDNFACASPGQ